MTTEPSSLLFQAATTPSRPTRVAVVLNRQVVAHADSLTRAAGFAQGWAARMDHMRRACPGGVQGEVRSEWYRGWDHANDYCARWGIGRAG